VADMKAVGQQTAAGNAQSNAPIPQLRHDPFAGGSIHVNNTAPIAPATGPCAADGKPLPPVDPEQLHREDRGLFRP
jgi:hypothetical protein